MLHVSNYFIVCGHRRTVRNSACIVLIEDCAFHLMCQGGIVPFKCTNEFHYNKTLYKEIYVHIK